MDRLKEFIACYWPKKVEQRLREALIPFGIGLHVSHEQEFRYGHHPVDIIRAFPTRRYNLETHKGIWEITLELCGSICQANIAELLRDHLLTPSEFEEWNRSEWEPWL